MGMMSTHMYPVVQLYSRSQSNCHALLWPASLWGPTYILLNLEECSFHKFAFNDYFRTPCFFWQIDCERWTIDSYGRRWCEEILYFHNQFVNPKQTRKQSWCRCVYVATPSHRPYFTISFKPNLSHNTIQYITNFILYTLIVHINII